MANVSGSMGKLFGALILIVATVAVAPTIFEELAGLGGTESDVPTWVVTLLTLIAGIGLVFIVWKVIDK